ncbi:MULTISPECIES: glycosyltransferase [unclassified Butyrivibrio]|uniref:glycosyltransferase n=1 Tax=unclassified Butyrivibrio TaxID=2639466 RepID=UPI00088727F3|nr:MULTISPECIES: glycosyltransferase [unclassified Butyrivibrio]SDB37576.1 Glycosyl transferase family 2 [Butyrivibrio sp. INlla16]SEK82514.1 Glycosyl transferase family 2 [Butyrivibrio sp. ob235]
MKKSFFTIIVVSYNAGEDLLKTLKSIKMQTFKDVSIVIKDGGSTDGSYEKAREFLSDDEKCGRALFIKGKDHGIYDAMNIAVSAVKEEAGNKAKDTEPGFIYFLNCGDIFSNSKVLQKVHSKIKLDEKNSGTIVPSIYYGDIYEMKTSQRVSSVPKINDFACYRNVPSHQACFYDERLMYRYAFDTVWKVRADYEHFLRCIYVEKALAIYMNLLIADYEGGGFSETRENRKVSETERQQIIHLYLPKKQIQKFDLIRKLTLAPLRTKIAENPKTAGAYNKVKSLVYKLKRH